MPQNYKQTKTLYHCILRVPKDEAYFVYFTFESNEGLCFHSTLDESLKGSYRDIDVKCTIELREALVALIEKMQKEIRLDILHAENLIDS